MKNAMNGIKYIGKYMHTFHLMIKISNCNKNMCKKYLN